MMNFQCKEITTTNNEFLCEITFSDKKDEGHIEGQKYEEILDSLGQYVMLQRSYGEDDFDQDYCTVEFSDFEKSGELEGFAIVISKHQFRMDYKGYVVEVDLDLDNDQTFLMIKDILRKITKDRGHITEIE